MYKEIKKMHKESRLMRIPSGNACQLFYLGIQIVFKSISKYEKVKFQAWNYDKLKKCDLYGSWKCHYTLKFQPVY